LARRENQPSKKSITDWNSEQYNFGNNIAKTIDDQKPVDTNTWKPSLQLWRPSLQKSQNEDPETKENKNEEF
jgi:hypothetical protein